MRIGLTGGLASGKTSVAERWQELGAVLIDSDVLAREVVAPGTPGLAAVAERFGAGVLSGDGQLDRKALGAMVFGDESARLDLEAILHPQIRARGRDLAAAAGPTAPVVHVIPLLVETAQADNFDAVVVVDIDPEVQIARATARDGTTREQAQARIAAQATREERLAAATHVIDNSGDRQALIDAADRVWAELMVTHNNQ